MEIDVADDESEVFVRFADTQGDREAIHIPLADHGPVNTSTPFVSSLNSPTRMSSMKKASATPGSIRNWTP